VRHHQSGAAAEYCQQIINQTALRILAGDDCLEDVGFADALGKAKGLFPFQAIDDRMFGRQLAILSDDERGALVEMLSTITP